MTELRDPPLDMEFLQGLVEQEGGKETTRGCRGNVGQRWNSLFLLVTIGNYCPDVGRKPPHGSERRANVLRMKHRFALKKDVEAPITEGDFDLQGKINSGALFNDFFHVAKEFSVSGSVRRQGSPDLAGGAGYVGTLRGRAGAERGQRTCSPLAELFAPASEAIPMLTAEQVRNITKCKLGSLRLADASTVLKSLCFDFDARVGGRRCVKCRFPETAQAAPLGKRT